MPIYLKRASRNPRARRNMAFPKMAVFPDGTTMVVEDWDEVREARRDGPIKIVPYKGTRPTDEEGDDSPPARPARPPKKAHRTLPEVAEVDEALTTAAAPSRRSRSRRGRRQGSFGTSSSVVYEDKYAQIGKSVGWGPLGYPYRGQEDSRRPRAESRRDALKARAKAEGVTQFEVALTDLGLTAAAADRLHAVLAEKEILCLGSGKCHATTAAQKAQALALLKEHLPARGNRGSWPRRRR